MANPNLEPSGNLLKRKSRYILAMVTVAFLGLIPAVSTVQANTLGINLYGISYHILDINQHRDNLNEFNPGFGVRASFGGSSSGTFFLEGGFFKDTFRNRATYLSTGYMFRTWRQFRLGLNAGIYKTNSINGGSGIVAIVPMASYTVKFVTLNVAYLPRYEGINAYHTFTAYMTVHLIHGNPPKKRAPRPKR